MADLRIHVCDADELRAENAELRRHIGHLQELLHDEALWRDLVDDFRAAAPTESETR